MEKGNFLFFRDYQVEQRLDAGNSNGQPEDDFGIEMTSLSSLILAFAIT